MGRMKAILDVQDPEAFVTSWALRFLKCQTEMDLDDLKQEGFIALIEAQSSFKEELGKFSAYAGSAVKFRLNQVVKNEKLRRRGRRNPREHETEIVSMDSAMGDGGLSLHETVGENDPGFEKVCRRQLQGFVANAARDFSKRSREIVNRRFMKGESLVEIGEALHLNAERVRQVLKGDLGLLRARVERAVR